MELDRARDPWGDEVDGAAFNPNQPGLIDDLGIPLPKRAAVATRAAVYHHQGPLPDPRTLAEYGRVDASLPERIVRMAEGQLEVQSYVAKKTVDAASFSVRSGALVAGILVLGSVVAFIYLAVAGVPLQDSWLSLMPAIFSAIAQVVAALRQSDKGD